MKTKNVFLALGVLLIAWIGVGSQIPTILPVSPVTEFVDFLKGMRATGPLEVGPVGRNLKTWWNFEDFVCGIATAKPAGIWIPANGGTGSSVYDLDVTALRPGRIALATGTTTTGYGCIYVGSSYRVCFLFGAGIYTIEADINLANLSTVTEAYTFKFGFGDTTDGADFVDGAYFEYSDVGSTPNWYKCTANGSTRTKTSTGVAAVSGAEVWTRLKIIVKAAATSVEYFINGTSVGVVTTNIAAGTTSAASSIIKSAGITNRNVLFDWAWIHVDLMTSR